MRPRVTKERPVGVGWWWRKLMSRIEIMSLTYKSDIMRCISRPIPSDAAVADPSHALSRSASPTTASVGLCAFRGQMARSWG
mmetsp:Transcript_12624/g.24147  ORF Transcript_12624/g.24147 Transcript_12624/m.24147 type:complete len:82 (-) Transcript_12624:108-353(-)